MRVSETAKRLARRGHAVTVLTTVPNYPTGVVPAEYRGRLVQEETRDGVRVIRTWSYATPSRGFLARVLAQLSFGCLAPLLGGGRLERPDVLLVESHPLFNAIAGRMLARRFRVPFALMVSDLWPESAVQLGMLCNPVLIRHAQRFAESTARKAGLLWAMTDGIRQGLLDGGVPAGRVALITNGVDTATFRPLPRAQARAELGWDGRFTVLYAGNHGLAQGLTTVLEAAERLRDRPEIRFVFAGDGAAKATLLREAQERDLAAVTFLDAQPHERMPLLLAGADVCLVPLRKLPLFRGALPSKMFEVMACARPMILGVEGEACSLAAWEAGAALAVEPENAEALARAILSLRADPRGAAEMGERGRAFVERYFDRERLTLELERRLLGLVREEEPACDPIPYLIQP